MYFSFNNYIINNNNYYCFFFALLNFTKHQFSPKYNVRLPMYHNITTDDLECFYESEANI